MSDFPREDLEAIRDELIRCGMVLERQEIWDKAAAVLRQAITAYDQLSDRLVMDTAALRAELGQKNDTIRALQALVAATTPEHGSQPERASAGQADGKDPRSGVQP